MAADFGFMSKDGKIVGAFVRGRPLKWTPDEGVEAFKRRAAEAERLFSLGAVVE